MNNGITYRNSQNEKHNAISCAFCSIGLEADVDANCLDSSKHDESEQLHSPNTWWIKQEVVFVEVERNHNHNIKSRIKIIKKQD